MKKLFKIFIFILLISSVVGLCFGCSENQKPQDGEYSSTLSISSLNLCIEKGKTDKIFAGYNKKFEISFVSSNDEIVTVTAVDGIATLTAVSVGEALITVRAGNQMKICKVTVFEYNYKIIFDRVEDEFKVCNGAKFFINAIVEVDGEISDLIVSWNVSGANCTLETSGNMAIVIPTEVGEVTLIAKYGNVSALFNFVVV